MYRKRFIEELGFEIVNVTAGMAAVCRCRCQGAEFLHSSMLVKISRERTYGRRSPNEGRSWH